MKIRPKIEEALSTTAERLSPGSGSSVVHHAKNDLSTIDGTSEDFNGRYADEDVRIAAPVIFEAKHLDGDPVVFKKHHGGVIVVFSDSFLYVRGMGFGAREVKAARCADVTVEAVATVVDGVEVPGLRITGGFGGPKFAVAMAPGDASAQASVRDEIQALLTS